MTTEDPTSLVDRLDALGVWTVEQPSSTFTDAVLRAAEAPRPKPRRRFGSPLAAACTAAVLLGAAAVALLDRSPAQGELEAATRRTIAIDDRATVVAEAGTRLAWAHDDNGTIRVAQHSGSAFYRVEGGDGFEVVTPAGIVGVTGTCFTVEVEDMNTKTKRSWIGAAALGSAVAAAVVVTVYEGDVVLANDDGEVAVAAGERATARGGSSPQLDDRQTEGAPDTIAALRAQNRAHERELSRLRHALAERDTAATPDDEGAPDSPEPPGAPGLPDPLLATLDDGFAYYDPTPEALEKMADCGVVAWDQPPVWDGDSAFDAQWRDDVGLAAEEGEVVDTALAEFRDRSVEQLRDFYVEFGGDAQAVASFSAGELLQLVYARLDRQELVATREAIARERAGREDPPDDPSLAGRFMRWEAQLGDAFEDDLGRRLGPGRAHELRAAGEGWSNKRLTYTNLCG
jgi:hypothetical protein